MAPPFEESASSDIDSISVNTTEPSDVEDTYEVEKILVEESDNDGVPYYLVKWQGYPLHRSTWEPAENLLSGPMLPNWQKKKQQIENGTSTPFDLDTFNAACEKNVEEKDERARRRAAKKKKLGIIRSRSTSNGSAPDVAMREASESPREDEPSPERQRPQKISTAKRKGVAQKVKKSLNRRKVEASSSEESSEDDAEDDRYTSEDSLLEESRRAETSTRGRSPVKQTKSASTRPRTDNTVRTGTTTSSKGARKPPPASASPSTRRQSTVTTESRTANTQKAPVRTSAARKSAPSTGHSYEQHVRRVTAQDSDESRSPERPAKRRSIVTKRTSIANSFISSGTTEAPRKQRVRSGSGANDIRFRNLAEQNRVHKSGTREAAPDPSLLATYNRDTGRMEFPPSAAATTAVAAASPPIAAANPSLAQSPKPPQPNVNPTVPPAAPHTIANAQVPPRELRRMGQTPAGQMPSAFARREVPPRERQRSISPPSPIDRRHLTLATNNHDPTRERTRTCSDWRNGVCNKPVSVCWFAHYFITCPEWRNGSCNFRDAECPWEHHEVESPPSAGPSTAPPTTASSDMPPANQVRRHPATKNITCRFWQAGHCYKTDAQCPYAHRDTGNDYVGNPTKPAATASSDMQPGQNKFYQSVFNLAFKDITCSHWNAGGCSKTEAVCKFAHRDTGHYMGPRGSHKVLSDPAVFALSGTHDATRDGTGQSPPSGPAMMSSRDHDHDNHMIVDDGPGQVMSPGEVSPVSRRSSLSFQRPPAFSHDIVLAVKCGLDAFDVKAKLVCATQNERSLLVERMGSRPLLNMQQMVNVADLQHYFSDALQQGAQLPCGDILPDAIYNRAMGQLAEMCKSQVCCGIVTSARYSLLVFPTGAEEWKFLNRPADATSSQAALKFKLLPHLKNETPQEAPADSDLDAPHTIVSDVPAKAMSYLLDVDVDRLLTIREGQQHERVFIMMPPSRTAELELLADAIKSRKCHVKTSLIPGSWDEWLNAKHSLGLVILHDEVPLWSVPRLGKVLHQSSYGVFSVGLNTTLAAQEKRAPKFESQRLFAMGDVVFITDDVFLDYPEKAFQVIQNIKNMNYKKPSGAVRCKVAARPGAIPWLMNLAIDRTRDRAHSPWLTLFEAISELSPPEFEDKFYPGNPSDEADLVSIAPEQLPTFQELDKSNQSGALDYAVRWYASWAYMNASQFRRFSVCHVPPTVFGQISNTSMNADPRGWADDYRHLIVETPDQWLQRQQKKAKKPV
ncbi:hypothetical protein Q7P37_010644 [Cladosporium fusiforme]